MFNQQLSAKFRAQAALEFQAHCLGFALCIWAKSQHWPGTHKWMQRFADDQRKDTKGILKFLADYADESVAWPASVECAATADGLKGAYAQIQAAVRASLEGWRALAAQAEEDEEMAVESFADDYMLERIRMIKKLTRFGRILERIAADQAAQIAFDEDRK